MTVQTKHNSTDKTQPYKQNTTLQTKHNNHTNQAQQLDRKKHGNCT